MSTAKTISELSERGWVQSTMSPLTELLDRRRTYYELARPLARLSFQLKAAPGKPVRLVVDFLKTWFDPDDLDNAIADDDLLVSYISEARGGFDQDPTIAVVRRLSRLPITRAPAVELLGRSTTP